MSWRAFDADGAGHVGNRLFHNGEAEPHAACFGGEVGIEYALQYFFRHSESGIAHMDIDHSLSGTRNNNHAPAFDGLRGVAKQIYKGTAQLFFIRMYARQIFGERR